MTIQTSRGRELRAWWATLAAICFLGAGIAYGVSWYTQGQLEKDATRDARKLTQESIQPLLTASDASGPVRGARYDELLSSMRSRVLAGPINGVRLWRSDGTIVFADDADLVGSRDAGMRDELLSVSSGASDSVVEGDRFRTFTALRFEDSHTVLVAELDRSHDAVVADARDRWSPWVKRGLVAGAIFVALYVATRLFFAMYGTAERLAAERRRTRDARPAPARAPRKARAAEEGANMPAYMQPGFQEEVQARRRVEEELESIRRERDMLRERVRHLEMELDRTKARQDELARQDEPEPPGELDRLQALARERLGG